MSFNLRNQRVNKKRTGRKRRRNRSGYGQLSQVAYTTSSRPAYGFLEPHMYVTLRYSANDTFVIATITGSDQIFNMNSLFDPDRTGVGHQPYGYDQLAAIYNRYRVLKCKWHVEFAASSLAYYALVVPTNGALSTPIIGAVSYSSACEVPFAVNKLVSANAPSVKFNGAMDMNVILGVTNTEYLADDRFEALVSTSPAELVELHLGVYNSNGSTVTLYYSTVLEFEVDFHDPIILTPS